MESGDTEIKAFEATVQCVHYIDPPDPKAFPSEPVRKCDVLLLEKTFMISEGTGRRRFYNGHRLVAVTPPSSKTLSSMNQSLGKQTPILISHVRGEDDGPAILLRNEVVGSTLVITFNDHSSRDHFQASLDGTLLKDSESCTPAIPLRAAKFEALGNDPATGSSNQLNNWRWQQMRIIDRDPETSENGLRKTVLSESLRIWAQCDAGTFVDRINLGIPA